MPVVAYLSVGTLHRMAATRTSSVRDDPEAACAWSSPCAHKEERAPIARMRKSPAHLALRTPERIPATQLGRESAVELDEECACRIVVDFPERANDRLGPGQEKRRRQATRIVCAIDAPERGLA